MTSQKVQSVDLNPFHQIRSHLFRVLLLRSHLLEARNRTHILAAIRGYAFRKARKILSTSGMILSKPPSSKLQYSRCRRIRVRYPYSRQCRGSDRFLEFGSGECTTFFSGLSSNMSNRSNRLENSYLSLSNLHENEVQVWLIYRLLCWKWS